MIHNYIPAIHNTANSWAILNLLRGATLYPSIDAARFLVNGIDQHGGYVPAGAVLSMINPNAGGTIYYTLDGADPRVPAGSISPSALPYTGPVPIEQTTLVKARVLSGAQWSPVHEAVYAAGPVAESLRITELMYHPADPPAGSPWTAQDLEYIELANIGDVLINLNQVRFTNGVRFTFGHWPLGPGQYVLVASNPDALVSIDPNLSSVIAGRYTGNLDNGGERLKLVDAVGATIHDFRYKDGWYAITDGAGFSLTIRDPQAAPNAWSDKSAWRPSAMVGGSPGFDDSGVVPEPGAIVINEVLAHSHAETPDWIELHNTTDRMINIGGWYLSDNDGSDSSRMKYRIPIGTILPAGGYIVFYENLHFGAASTDGGVVVPFALSENGEEVVLRSAIDGVLTGYRNYEDFGASQTGVSFGRYRKSDGSFNFVAMSSPTPGAANAYPLVGPIVINEIMYNPPSGNQSEEYVELHNITSSPVMLYDYITSQPWKFTDGIELTFPSVPPITIPAGGYLLVVKDAAAFTACYGAPPPGVQMLPYESGNLDNAGEKVEISMPGDVDGSGIRCYIRVDRVNYSDGSHPLGSDPWPAAADGAGHSLHRKGPALYGNDVANWRSAAPTPGRP